MLKSIQRSIDVSNQRGARAVLFMGAMLTASFGQALDVDTVVMEAPITIADLEAERSGMPQRYSDAPLSTERGGALGQIFRGQTLPEFKEALFALHEPGELSGLVKSRFSIHTIRLDGRTDGRLTPYEQVARQLVDQVRLRIRKDRRQAMVDPTRDPDRLTVYQDALVTAAP